MNSELKLHFIVTLILWLAIFNLQLTWVRADPINQTCGGTEVCRFPSTSETFEINCNCSALGGRAGQCHWVTFADRGRVFSNGPLLSLERSTISYGQYICVGSNNATIRNVLILPAGTYTCLLILVIAINAPSQS